MHDKDGEAEKFKFGFCLKRARNGTLDTDRVLTKRTRDRTVDTDALMALHPPFHFTLCAFIHPAEVVVVVDLAPHDGHLVLLLL